MATRSLKPYLFDGFYRWCVDGNQTPLIEFLVTPDCMLPKHLLEQHLQSLILNVSANSCRDLSIDDAGISFVTRFEGVSFKVFVPLAALLAVHGKESTRSFPLNFTEVVLDLNQPTVSRAPLHSLSPGLPPAPSVLSSAHPASPPSSPLSLVRPNDMAQRTVPERKRHLSLVRNEKKPGETLEPPRR